MFLQPEDFPSRSKKPSYQWNVFEGVMWCACCKMLFTINSLHAHVCLYGHHRSIVVWRCVFAVCLFVGCLSSQQHASVSQGRICTDNFTCCHTEIEAADQTFHLTQSQYTDTGPTSPSADPITPGAWQGSHWSASF